MDKNPKVILVGSPNVGKSVIFGVLTGTYATVSNYPGTTVEISCGQAKVRGKSYEIIDTPGLYSVYPITEEEKVTLKIIRQEKRAIIVHVIDAKNIERSLPLTFQLIKMRCHVIVVLNMFDELLSQGMTIETGPLSDRLGLPVVATVAVANQGMGVLTSRIEAIAGAHREFSCESDPPQYSQRLMHEWYKKTSEITSAVMKKSERPRKLTKFDKLLISPVSGFLILALILYLGLYKFVGSFGAGTVVNFLEENYQNYLTPWLAQLADKYIPWASIQGLFVGEFGILTLGLRYALAIILPIVGFFFFVFAIIEDSGYLPRLAYLLDSVFKKIGLSGRAVIPMVLGLGCDTMATMVVRTLSTRRERIIATFLLSLTIPCSAQMGVIMGLLAARPKVLFLWAAIILAIFGIAGAALSKLMPGAGPTFIMEIPPMRVPKLKNVFMKTYMRMEWYFKEIIPVFIAASVLIWLGQITGVFGKVIEILAGPLSSMGLPSSTASAFLFGFFRRDYGAAGLYDLAGTGALSGNQLLISTVVLTLFLPCVAQLIITIKERGWKIATVMSLFILIFAFAVGVLINGALNFARIIL